MLHISYNFGTYSTLKTRFSIILFKLQFLHLFIQQFLNSMTKRAHSLSFFLIRASTVDVGYVLNAKYLAHIPHQTQKIRF